MSISIASSLKTTLPSILIGIDPDLKKSGFAVWHKHKKTLDLKLFSFPELLNRLAYYSHGYLHEEVQVVVEAGWLNKKSNFHFEKGQSKAKGERIAKNVGENHAVGKLIIEMCESYNLKCKTSAPTESKTKAQFFKKLTGIECKNQEMIDAGMLVFGY